MAEHSGILEQQRAESASAAWVKIELARHPQRPYPMDFVERLFTDFSEIHGDRAFGDDPVISCGMARFHGEEVMVVMNLKGRTTKEKIRSNFGMPNPEGYRKALRAMKIAEKFHRPVFTFIDIPGAWHGVSGEERGQAEAIARNLKEMSRLRVPIIATITGEGGSGGALAIAVADRVLMLENAIYSVISPESGASIMWRDAGRKADAAAALRVTSAEIKALGCIDDVVAEPGEGAQTDFDAAASLLDAALTRHFDDVKTTPIHELVAARHAKFRNMGQFYTV
jgi:acetyl-CoA carboxylase carboxyl transferase subunit alpha